MERKLIYADELEKKLIDMGFYPVLVKGVMEKMMPVNAVKVVRCKECKDCIEGYCVAEIDGSVILRSVKDDDFCSYGERKEERRTEFNLKPKAEYLSYNNHDCETIYKCPVCNERFSSWQIFHQRKKLTEWVKEG